MEVTPDMHIQGCSGPGTRLAKSIYYYDNSARWEPPPGGVELASEPPFLVNYSNKEPSRFNKIRVMEQIKPFDIAPYQVSTAEVMRRRMAQFDEMLRVAFAPTPQQEADIQRAMQEYLCTGINWVQAPVMGIDWGAGTEPEPKDTPKRARERSEGLCGWKGGVRDSDRQGIAAARVDEDWAEQARAYFAPPEAPPAKPSAGLLTIAEPTHKLGGWGV